MQQARFDDLIATHGGTDLENVRYIATTSGKNWNMHSSVGVKARYSLVIDGGTLIFTHNEEVGPEVMPVVECTEVDQVELVAFFRDAP
jgi:hypothetical protein